MAGTVVGMFTGAGQDSSVASRINSYDVAFGMVSRLPLFGRAFGTLLPSYVFVDNQYLGIVVELGVVGIAVTLTFFGFAVALAWRAHRFASNRLASQLGVAIAAGLCAGSLSFTFFDALSFPLSAGFMFLMLGLAGAYRRIIRSTSVQSDDLPANTTVANPKETPA
jgi:O-antigen ligase